MNANLHFSTPLRWAQSFGIATVLFLSAFLAMANPIEVPERPTNAEAIGLTVVAIGFEVCCVVLLLRKTRRPRLFAVWLLAMHLITFPAFLWFLSLLTSIRPVFSITLGEGLVVIIEGVLIYLICRFAPPRSAEVPPTVSKCVIASLAGNICSAATFPLLVALFDVVVGG